MLDGWTEVYLLSKGVIHTQTNRREKSSTARYLPPRQFVLGRSWGGDTRYKRDGDQWWGGGGGGVVGVVG